MKTLPKNLCTIVVSAVICLFLAEILVRIFAPQQLINSSIHLYKPDPIYGKRHLENLNLVVNCGEGYHHFVTDSLGNRINFTKSTIAHPDISILGIGDSFLEGESVENEQTMLEVFADLLANEYGIRVSATNTGVSGWSPNEYYMQTVKSLEQHHYDLGLVFLFCANDVITQIDTIPHRKIRYRDQNLPAMKTAEAWFQRYVIAGTKSFLEKRSHLFILTEYVICEIVPKFGKTMDFIYPVFKLSERNSTCWEVTADMCQMIKNQFDKYHIPILFVLIPGRWQVQEELFYRYLKFVGISPDSVNLDQPNQALAAAFAQRSLTLLDPIQYMRQKADAGFSLYGVIDRHLNEVGHRAVGEYIFRYVLKNLPMAPGTAKLLMNPTFGLTARVMPTRD